MSENDAFYADLSVQIDAGFPTEADAKAIGDTWADFIAQRFDADLQQSATVTVTLRRPYLRPSGRLEVLRSVRHGGSVTQALHKLDELDGRETIKLQLVQHLEGSGTGNDDESIMDAEFEIGYLPPSSGLDVYYGLHRYSYGGFPELHVDDEGNRTWILTARRRD